jgi:hypothetical protein
MTQLDPTQDYSKPYHTYPLFSSSDGYEGSFKIYDSPPTPKDLINYALKGLPKYYPLTNEPITEGDVTRYLTAANNEIQMDLGADIYETIHWQSTDFVDGMFGSNFTGIKLTKWPATKIIAVRFKFAHTQTNTPIQSYLIPAAWVMLRRNKVNIVPSYGGMIVQTSADTNAAGVFQYMTGFARGAWHPGIIEVQYASGFDNDRFPALLKDLILTVAAIRLLTDLSPKLFPYSSSSVSLDGISQSASLPGPMFLMKTLELLQQKRDQLTATFNKYFGRTIKMGFIGA